jgi:hypothetical protein
MKLCKRTKKSKEQLYKVFTDKQNKSQAKEFSLVPFHKRIVFAPHCMRNISVCVAVERGSYYICKECGGCKINNLNNLVKKLNYQALYILKGGSSIVNIIKEQKPQGIVGIACSFEGAQAFKLLKEEDVSVQFVPLTKEGCTDTDVDLQEIEKILNQK